MKSSFRQRERAAVEVAFLPDGGAAGRDTEDRTLREHRYTAAERDAFLAGVRAGEFDRP